MKTHRHFFCPSDPQSCHSPNRCTSSECSSWCCPDLQSVAIMRSKKSVCVKRWSENLPGRNAPGNLHLKLICAIRAPRIWTGCIEVSWRGTESPAANLSSFSQHHLWENIYSYSVLSCRYLTDKNIKEPIVPFAHEPLRNWCVKARGVRLTNI